MRNAINTILADKIYQRGQILSWSREYKLNLFQEKNIGAVVNFWPKIDPDLAEVGLDWYLYLPVPRSINMTSDPVMVAVDMVVNYLLSTTKSVLILCEAGRTRSVFFSALVLRELLQLTKQEAYQRVVKAVPGHSLKNFMIDYLNN